MILRRIADGIKNQDWFVVVIEIFIVVIGIYFGLQVDDWNKARQERVSEAEFIVRFHDDLLLAEALSSRVFERRLNLIHDLSTATDVVLANFGRDTLTVEECRAIGDSRYFSMNISGLPALSELMATGGLQILQDQELRRAILHFQQRGERLKDFINQILLTGQDLPSKFPELINSAAYVDKRLNEYQQNYTCHLDAMKASQSFKNDLSASIDGYDAYLRDGLRPWAEQFQRVHGLVDAKLGITHEGETQ